MLCKILQDLKPNLFIELWKKCNDPGYEIPKEERESLEKERLIVGGSVCKNVEYYILVRMRVSENGKILSAP